MSINKHTYSLRNTNTANIELEEEKVVMNDQDESNTSLQDLSIPTNDISQLLSQLSLQIASLNEQNKMMENKITQQINEQENKITQQINEQENKIAQKINEQNTQMREQMDMQKEQICERLIEHITEQNNQIEQIRTDVAKFNSEIGENVRNIQERVNQLEENQIARYEELAEDILTQKCELQMAAENTRAEQKRDMENLKKHLIEEQKELVIETKGLINDQNQKIESCRRQIETLGARSESSPNGSRREMPEIIINVPNHIEGDLIKFSGRSNDPVGYLNKLKKHYQRQVRNSRQTEHEKIEILHETIELSFESYASRWWTLIKHDVHTWEQFEELFLSKYWDANKQRLVLRRIESEKYLAHGRQTRSEYIEGKIVTLKAMSNNYTDEDIIDKLSDHFDEITRNAIRVQNIKKLSDFELLLYQDDIRDEQEEIKRRINIQENNHNSTYRRTMSGNYINRNIKDTNSHFRPHNSYNNRPYNVQPYNRNHRGHNYYDNKPKYAPNHNFKNNYYGKQRRNSDGSRPNSPQHRYNTDHNFRRYPSKEQINTCQAIAGTPMANRPTSEMNVPDNHHSQPLN